MAYLNGFKHDVFVSYAHLDNEKTIDVGGELQGWVDLLVDKLGRELRQRLGKKSVDVWIDRDLAENRPLTPEIMRAIEASATLLVVMSPSYINSEWCKRERQAFLSLVKDRVADGSVFIVHARPVDPTSMPSEFCDLLGFPFWTRDPEIDAERPLGTPDPNEDAFIKKIFKLSYRLEGQLTRLSKATARVKADGAPPPASKSKINIYVARATEDLEDREEDIKAYLEQAGYTVLPEVRYPQTSLAEFEAAMRRDIERCSAFVQLLSPSRGRELEFAPGKRLPVLQSEIAARASIHRMPWRDQGITLESIHDVQHRALLDTARACGIEEFKRAVVEATTRTPATIEPVRSRPGLAVFLNADAADRPLAKVVGEALAKIDVDCFLSLAEGQPETIRLDLERNLRDCDGLILLYGATDPQWVRAQLMQSRKILSSRERPLAALAILEGPPPDKLDLAITSARLNLLDCRQGIDEGVLRGFIQQLDG